MYDVLVPVINEFVLNAKWYCVNNKVLYCSCPSFEYLSCEIVLILLPSVRATVLVLHCQLKCAFRPARSGGLRSEQKIFT